MENNWYIYRHLKPNGEVFYIGIGKTKNFQRAYNKVNRSVFWKRVVAKYDYEVQILTTGLTKEQASEFEIMLVAYHKRIDCCGGTLVNMTDGGDGVFGRVCSEETKRKLSLSNKGKKLSEETKLKISLGKKGTQVGEKSPMYGKIFSEITRNKMSLAKMGHKLSEAHSKKLKESKTGGNHHSAKLVMNLETGIFYETIKEAAESINIKPTTLRAMLRGENKNKTNFIYVI